jgi:general secretion pathway protein J
MRQDFQTVSATRGIRDNDGEAQYPFRFDSLTQRLECTHGGFPNPLGLARTGFERVSYQLENHKLIRSTWHVLDRAPRSEPVDATLLSDVDNVEWRFLDSKLQWQGSWPTSNVLATPLATQTTGGAPTNPPQQTLGGSSTPPPIALELKLRAKDWGELRFLFQLGFDPAAVSNPATSTTTATGSS